MQKRDKIMSLLCYLGLFWLIPFIMARDEARVKFHITQGFNLMCIGIIVSVVKRLLVFAIPIGLVQGVIGFVFTVIVVLMLALMVIGIINVINENEKPLPVIGFIRIL